MDAEILFSPTDFELAHEAFDAMCGHGALAAALGKEVCDVMKFFDQGGWVNVPMMRRAAYHAANSLPVMVPRWPTLTETAVALIQFLGPWMEPGILPAARCKYRHWVAVRRGLVWDVNEPRWLGPSQWEQAVVPGLMPKRGTGWELFRSILIKP